MSFILSLLWFLTFSPEECPNKTFITLLCYCKILYHKRLFKEVRSYGTVYDTLIVLNDK